jgi:hypothetical protein
MHLGKMRDQGYRMGDVYVINNFNTYTRYIYYVCFTEEIDVRKGI